MSDVVKERLRTAAHRLGAVDPVPAMGSLLDRSFSLPPGSAAYAANPLLPGAVPCEPSFSERECGALRFAILPLGPEASPLARQHEATREMRRYVGGVLGPEPLSWFDHRSEAWRGATAHSGAQYGAWIGPIFDEDGQRAARVYYELHPDQLDAVTGSLGFLVRTALATMPSLIPVFTLLRCGREGGRQRVVFRHQGPLQLARLATLMGQLGLVHQLGGLMQVVGVALGGRFELPDGAVFIGFAETLDGPEMTLEILLDQIPDLPDRFVDLLALALSERPRPLHALGRWIRAFTPSTHDGPGDFTVLSVRVTPRTSARMSLHLKPAGFEVGGDREEEPTTARSWAPAI
jgi:hypothetical protein